MIIFSLSLLCSFFSVLRLSSLFKKKKSKSVVFRLAFTLLMVFLPYTSFYFFVIKYAVCLSCLLLGTRNIEGIPHPETSVVT